MLKSGKLKLADDMVVTAQEATNKAETVFTIYDDTTNTQIASGKIGEEIKDPVINLEKINTVNDAEIVFNATINMKVHSGRGLNDTQNYTILTATQLMVLMPEETGDLQFRIKSYTASDDTILTATYDRDLGGYIAITNTNYPIQNTATQPLVITFEAPK